MLSTDGIKPDIWKRTVKKPSIKNITSPNFFTDEIRSSIQASA